jgi:regulator of protease activity HflC (stomatin/prohibitin superfamily)
MLFFAPLLVVAVILLFSSVRIVREYERGIVYTFGKYSDIRNPGLQLVIPGMQQMTMVDIRIRTEDIPSQDVISKDNVSVKVNAVVYYRVVEPSFAINRVENFIQATSQLAQTTLRSVLGKHDLDEMLAQRDKLNHDIQDILDTQTDGWGVKVTNVEIKHVDIDPSMVRAIAKQAEAERERRAKIIIADAEFQAAKQLDEAAKILAQRQKEQRQARATQHERRRLASTSKSESKA